MIEVRSCLTVVMGSVTVVMSSVTVVIMGSVTIGNPGSLCVTCDIT